MNKITSKPSREGIKAEKALQAAVARVAEENRRLGLPVAVMNKGRAVLIPSTKALNLAKEERARYGTGHK